VGVAIPFSFSRRRLGADVKPLIKHVFIRSLILAVLGVVLWQIPGGAHPTYGFYSVLYRIGFSYFFASLIFLKTDIRGQIYWTFGILMGYWILMRFVFVPEFGIGNFTKEGNVATYIHNWVGKVISPDFSYVLSPTLLTSISNALMGVLAGHWLMSDQKGHKKAIVLIIAGMVLMLLAALSHLDFPINKKLASPSFTMLACGISAILLGLFYWMIDVHCRGC
jgi:predicted acyltransferase